MIWFVRKYIIIQTFDTYHLLVATKGAVFQGLELYSEESFKIQQKDSGTMEL